jgi:serine/threonine protein kinase
MHFDSQVIAPVAMVGTRLGGRYLVERKLEDSSVGEVYVASDLQSDELTVRVAVVRSEISEDPAALAVLCEDVRRTQTLSHPNIAGIYSVNSVGSTVYLVMEHLEGKVLDQLIDETMGRGLPFSAAQPTIEDICAALSYAHRHGVVHTDLKPSSVFVTTAGKSKLLDLGISRAVRGQFNPAVVCAQTPAYASCEVFEGHVPDPRDDVYSLGCVIYQILSGRHPFSGNTAVAARNTKLKVDRLPTLSRSQNAALAKALAFERDRRTESVQALLTGLIRGVRERDAAGAHAAAAKLCPPPPDAAGVNVLAGRDQTPAVERGLLETVEIATPGSVARIELHCGDLTAMESNDAVDTLVLSAYPGGGTLVENSLVMALERKGISVAALAMNKQIDLRSAFSCWLSRAIPSDIPGIQFKRILCFEPLNQWSSTPEAVGDIFRALAPFSGGNPRISSVAMPIIAARSQAYSVRQILTPLLNSAIEWLALGLPLQTIKIFVLDPSRALAAKTIFLETKARLGQKPQAEPVERRYDAFISYAREDSDAAKVIATSLKGARLRVYLDELELDHGSAWQQHIFDALDATKRVVAVYSPDYVQSKVCQEEFNIAWARARKSSSTIIFPVYWRSGSLPTYMEMLNYADCREQRIDKLSDACQRLAERLKSL